MERRGSNYNSPTTSAGPCITLLQERFKQLKRQREEREEKQLLDETVTCKRKHMSSSTTTTKTTKNVKQLLNYDESANVYSFTGKDDLFLPRKICLDDPLSLGLNNLSSKHIDYRDMRNQAVTPSDHKRVTITNSHRFESRDVDTSLHL